MKKTTALLAALPAAIACAAAFAGSASRPAVLWAKPLIANGYQARFSPDGTWISFAYRTPTKSGRTILCVQHPDGSGLHCFGSLPGAVTGGGSWLPDGKSLIVDSGKGIDHLYRVTLSGAFTQLTNGPGDTSPSVSADGNRVVYVSTRAEDGNYTDLYLLNLATGQGRLLTHTLDDKSSPAFSPGGRLVVFSDQSSPVFHRSTRTWTGPALDQVDVTTGKITTLFTSVGRSAWVDSPVFSPNGRYIAFGLGNGTPSSSYQYDRLSSTYLYDRQTRDVHKLIGFNLWTPAGSTARVGVTGVGPTSFSPDGNWLAYDRQLGRVQNGTLFTRGYSSVYLARVSGFPPKN